MIHFLISLLVLTAKWCSSGECGGLDNHEDPFTHHQSYFLLCSVCRSRGVATVSAAGSFNPDKINIFNKDCDISGRKHSCFNTKLCFTATFRPNNPVGPMGENCAVPPVSFQWIQLNVDCLMVKFPVRVSLSVTELSYTLTLDADLQASRVTSRGLFTTNNERYLTDKMKVSTQLCLPFEVYVQVRCIYIYMYFQKIICLSSFVFV